MKNPLYQEAAVNLDQLTIEIRPRRAWEAVDLGLLMARHWWWPMTKVWLLLSLPLFILLNFLPQNLMWLSYTLVWWLKPLFERPLLHILAQAVFNQTPDTAQTLKTFPKLARQQAFASLTWRRFSFSRSMDLPVIQLEGLGGSRRQERLSVLHREESNPASCLTVIGAHLECFISLGLIVLLYILIPAEMNLDWLEILSSDASWFNLLANACSYVAMTLVAPFYVACGFAVYLNRRIHLEAWDIDIAFQRMVNKRRQPSSHPSQPMTKLIVLALAWMLAFGVVQTPEARANQGDVVAREVLDPQASETSPPSEADHQPLAEMQREYAKSAIEAILAGDSFHQKQIIRYPSFGEDAEKKSQPSEFWKGFFDQFASAQKLAGIASGLEMVLWAAVICLILLVAFRYRYWLAAYLPVRVKQAAPRPKPQTLFGMDLTQESLPADISAAALNLWQRGDQRSALALLYRASLSRLLDAGLEIDEGHTEQECLRIAEAAVTPESSHVLDYFAQVTGMWRRLAYGHIAPNEEDGERACRHWNDLWNSPADHQTRPTKAVSDA